MECDIFMQFFQGNHRACFSKHAVLQNPDKIYELRTYSLKPEHMKEYLTLTSEKFHLRTIHSVLHGYWTVELGGVNQVVHLWEYGKNRAILRFILSEYHKGVCILLSHTNPLVVHKFI